MVSMLRSAAVLALLFVAVAAAAQTPSPVVESITPNSGPVTGGTVVTLRGRNFAAAQCREVDGCTVSVQFATPHRENCCVTGKAKVLFATDTRIDIETPEHGNTLVDVHVTSAFGTKTVVRNGFRFGRGGFRRVLVPVAWNGVLPGAFGSAWVTELTGRVFHRDTELEVTRTPFSATPHRVQNSFRFEDLPGGGYRGGIFIYVPEEQQIDLSLRIRDISREQENFGTEVPLVTEEETSPAYSMGLLDIPVGPKYRSTLRIYNFDGRRPAAITLIIRPRDSTEELLFQTYHFGGFPIEEFPSLPGYLQLNIDDLLPKGYAGQVDVQVGNAQSGPRTWAMISVTNNDTQMVTMVTPSFRERAAISFIP
jgi:IPT/TIG domain